MKVSGFQIPNHEIQFTAMPAGGPGGQHVNKASTSVQLRFDINNSSLPESCKLRLFDLGDSRITEGGMVVIKAQRFRSQQLNKRDAINRLAELIASASKVAPKRKATTPPPKAKRIRLNNKKARAKIKNLRASPRKEEI